MNFDDILDEATPSTIYNYVAPMDTATLKAFSIYIGNIAANTPTSDQRWHELALMDKATTSELMNPQRLNDLQALMPALPGEPGVAPPPDDEFVRELTALINKHGLDTFCHVHDWRLAKLMRSVLDGVARMNDET